MAEPAEPAEPDGLEAAVVVAAVDTELAATDTAVNMAEIKMVPWAE